MQTRYTNETHSDILLKAKLPGATVMQENQVKHQCPELFVDMANRKKVAYFEFGS